MSKCSHLLPISQDDSFPLLKYISIGCLRDGPWHTETMIFNSVQGLTLWEGVWKEEALIGADIWALARGRSHVATVSKTSVSDCPEQIFSWFYFSRKHLLSKPSL